MTDLDMAAAFEVADHLAEDIAAHLEDAANEADVALSVYAEGRYGDQQVMLARELVRLLVGAGWTFTNADDGPESGGEAESVAEPETRAVTGTFHQAGPIRPDPIGRRRAVGFQHTTTTTTTEKENR